VSFCLVGRNEPRHHSLSNGQGQEEEVEREEKAAEPERGIVSTQKDELHLFEQLETC
jgi:hypothetical protein